MNIIDKIISTLEMFTERQHDEVLDCIPGPEREAYSNNWRAELAEQAEIYERYRSSLETVRRSRSVQNVPRNILDMIFEHIDEMEEE